MKNKLSILLFFICLILYLSCGEKSKQSTEPEDSTPPSVTITLPTSGATVSEITKITCVVTDNVGVKMVELWVDGVSTGETDNTEPYSLDWNTTIYQDSSIHTITIRAFDLSNNKTDSGPISLRVDNTNSFPNQVNITNVSYTITEMTINWSKSDSKDFAFYELFSSETENGIKTSVIKISDIDQTSHIITNFDLSHVIWFWITVTDTLGFSTLSDGFKVEDDKPNPSQIKSIAYQNNSFFITWTINNEYDFLSYTLYQSFSSNMTNEQVVFSSNNRSDTTFVISGITSNEFRYYQMEVEDYWNKKTRGSVKLGSCYPNKIVFLSNNGGNYDISIMNSNGEDQMNLTNSSSVDERNPAFTPDGNRIVFQSNDDGDYDIYIMNIDGTNKVKLLNNVHNDWNPQVSPDGSKIVFVSNIQNIGYQVFIMDINGNNPTSLTNGSGIRTAPQFSPDGTEIIYSEGQIWRMNIDGSGKTQLTNVNRATNPEYSPDGLKIIFQNEELGGIHDIYTIDSDGSNQMNLTNGVGPNRNPKFSPDGGKIAFSSRREMLNWEIFLMEIDGSNQTNISNNPNRNDDNPQFSPSDGSKIIFDDFSEIFIMNIDGSDKINLSNKPDDDVLPIFQPTN